MNTQFRDFAERLHAWDANVSIIVSSGSHPYKNTGHKWKAFMGRPQSEAEFEALPWFRSDMSGIGVVSGPGGWRCIDIDDSTSFRVVELILDALRLPHSYPWLVKTGSGKGWHIWIRCEDDLPAGLLTGKTGDPGVRTGLPREGMHFDHLELRWERCQSVVPPSLHASGESYQFFNVVPAIPPACVSIEQVATAVGVVCQAINDADAASNSLSVSGTELKEDELKHILIGKAVARARRSNQRNESGLWLACQLRDNGFSQTRALSIGRSFVDDVARDKAGHAYTFSEYENSVEQAYSRPPRDAWEGEDDNPKKPAQAQQLIEIAQSAELFHTPNGDPYASFPVNGHLETAAVPSKRFDRWLVRSFYRRYERPPNSQALKDALLGISAHAQFDGLQREVFLRTAMYNGHIYIDLCNDAWEVVEITSEGWQIIKDPPVRFVRRSGMLALSKPERGGSLSEMLPFVNLRQSDHAVLLFGWLIHALHPEAPQPVLVITGEQGTGKSTASEMVRSLIDPSVSPIRGEPRSEHDLVIAAENGWVQAFENLSRIKPWLSDALCRISTGAGFATRQLYADRDQELFFARRPIILNGIDDLTTRADLADRAITIFLERIPEENRITEKELWQKWEEVQPRIQGGIFDAMVVALRGLPVTRPNRLPRMADFARWVLAAESSLPEGSGDFMAVYANVRKEAEEATIERDIVGSAVQRMLEREGIWIGSMTDLRERLIQFIPNGAGKAPRGWPGNGKATSARLRRIAPALRTIGIAVENRGKDPKTRRAMHAIEYIDAESFERSVDSEEPRNSSPKLDTAEGFPERTLFGEANNTGRSSATLQAGNGHFDANDVDSESSKESKHAGSLVSGTIVRHKAEGWEGTVTPKQDGSWITVLPFSEREIRKVPIEELEIKYSS